MNYKKFIQKGVGLLMLLGYITVVLFTTFVSHASATTINPGGGSGGLADASWISQSQISYNNQVFVDNKIDNTWEFHNNGDKNCDNYIHDFDGGEKKQGGGTMESNPTGAYYVVRTTDPTNTKACQFVGDSKGVHITLDNVDNSKADFVWQDATTVQAITGPVFSQNSTDGLFYEQGGDNCKDTLNIGSTGGTSGQLIVRTGGNNTSYDSTSLWINSSLVNAGFKEVSGCTVYNPITVSLSNYNNGAANPAGSSAAAQGSNSGGSSAAVLDCGGGVLNWIVCPVITLAQGAAEKLDTYISSTLTIDTSQTFDKNYYTAWNSFRILATALLVIAGLVMVGSQALGFDFLDAYTVRKVLPRMITAIIGMTLSWPLLKFGIELFNTIGNDVYGLITGPFIATHAKISVGVGALSTLLASAAGIAAVVTLGPAALLILVSGMLGLFMAFMILIIRQIAVIVIVILAPIAIACYILPNTQKVWNVWKDNFLGLMLMFPIVMAFIAAGHAFAAVSTSHPGVLSQIIGIIAYFIPYFLLPLAFKLATGVIGTISGMVNDRSKGVFDRMKGVRQNAREKRIAALRSGSLYQQKGLRGRINNTGKRVNAGYRGRYGFGEQGKQALALDTASHVEHTVKNNARLAQLANYDDGNAVLALSGGSKSKAEAISQQLFRKADGSFDAVRASNAVAAANAVGFNHANAAAALTTLAQNKSRPIGEGRVDLIQQGINNLAGENAAEATGLAYSFQYNSRQAGRLDLGGSWHQSNIQENAQTLQRSATAHGTTLSNQEALAAVTMMDGLGRSNINNVVAGHSNQVKQTLKTITTALEHGTEEQRIAAGQRILELQSALPYATGENQNLITKFMADNNLTPVRGDAGDQSLANQVAANISTLMANDGTARSISGAQLTAGARVFDRDEIARDQAMSGNA